MNDNFRLAANRPAFLAQEALIVATYASSFIEQELARFSNDQIFVYYEHVVVSAM